MSTIKLFNNDPYLKNCEATILEILPDQEGINRIIVLDQTVFYAMSGGQPGDRGAIIASGGTEEVLDTRYADPEKTIIHHFMATETRLQVGEKVNCMIDWDFRYRNMRLHSLIHIVGMAFEEMVGEQKCIGSNISDRGRIDYEYFGSIDLNMLTQEVRRLIEGRHDIHCTGDPGDEVKRIWFMEPLGEMACGGTHPKNSSEIGDMDIKVKSLGKQGQRIYCELLE